MESNVIQLFPKVNHDFDEPTDNTTCCDLETERLEKLKVYFNYFEVEARYGIDFNEFVRRVNAGIWDPYLASC